ncbi:MAG: acyl carrier protein [Planctomycetia bacterium]|nr:acyl carrier protein [Planctomycetia bacterium]
MDTNNIEDRVKTIVSDHLGFNKDEMTLETSFVNDLGADSLDLVELVMELEDEFGITIPEDATEDVQTIGDVVEHIGKELAEKKG